jgi:hypothetical protein
MDVLSFLSRVAILHFPTQAEGCVEIDSMQDSFGTLKQGIQSPAGS